MFINHLLKNNPYLISNKPFMYSQCLKTSSRTVLKNGFVKLIDCMPKQIPFESKVMGCDYAIVQAARVSYAQGTKDIETDSKLIKYLYKNKHTSPFEMVKFKFHVKAPIFVARQWFRHRMGNYNEISGRYTILPNEIYIPSKVSSQSKENKQLSSNDDLLKDENINEHMDDYIKGANNQFNQYKKLLKIGVSRETARIALPLNMFTEFYFCIDLHNLLNFIKLRNSWNAQYEIKEYACAIEDIISPLCPITMEAYKEYKTVTLTNAEYQKLMKIDKK